MLPLYQVALSLSLGSLALVAFYVGDKVLRCRRALRHFREQSCGLPILEEARSPISNHGVEWHMGRNTCKKITRWHAKHGKTFGFLYGERPCASTIDLDLIKRIHVDEMRQHVNRIPFHMVVYEYDHDNILCAEDDQWRRLRRAVGPALKKCRTPNMVAEIEAAVDKFVGHLERRLSDAKQPIEVDADNLTHKFSMDVTFRSIYKQSNLIDYDQEKCSWLEVVEEGMWAPVKSRAFKLCIAFPELSGLISRLSVMCSSGIGHWFREIHRFVGEQTRIALETRRQLIQLNGATGDESSLVCENFRLADGNEYKRFVIDDTIDHFLDGKISRSEYFNTTFFLFSAADSTAADAMRHTLYYLAANSAYQDKLRDSLGLEGLESTCLTWVITESLRLHPPVPAGCSRVVSHDIELPGGAGLLPAGTYVFTPLNTIHRLPEYWGDDAAEFKPERWRDTSHHHPMQYMPFGASMRTRPGREFALFEMKKLLVELVSRFTFECELRTDMEDFDAPYMIYTMRHAPIMMRVTKNH